MHKPLVMPLELPLQQPLASHEPDEPEEARLWEPTVRVVVFDDSPWRPGMPRDLEFRQQA